MDGLSVEFLPESDAPGPVPRRSRPDSRGVSARAALAAVLLMAVGVVTVHDVGRTTLSGHPVASPHPAAPPVSSGSSSPCGGSACTPQPSPAIRAVFAEHLPGSVVVDEHTLSRDGLQLSSRTLHAVYGNVIITVTIGPASPAALQSRGIHVERDGYLVDFRFVGYYPPTAGELRALANDPRLTSPQA